MHLNPTVKRQSNDGQTTVKATMGLMTKKKCMFIPVELYSTTKNKTLCLFRRMLSDNLYINRASAKQKTNIINHIKKTKLL